MARRTDNAQSLEAVGIETICDMMRNGDSYTTTAKKLKIERTALWRWVHADESRLDLVNEALTAAADACDEEAEHILRTMKDVGRARELAQHLRWRAKVRNPKIYGDKQQVGFDDRTLETLSEQQLDARLKAMLERNGGESGGT